MCALRLANSALPGYPHVWITVCVSGGSTYVGRAFGPDSSKLSRTLPTSVVDSWVRPCRLVALEGDHLRISAPNRSRATGSCSATCRAPAGRRRVPRRPPARLARRRFDSWPTATTSAPAAAGARRSGRLASTGLNPRYTFDTFVVGSVEPVRARRRQAVAELPSRAYNPLFIYGGVGLGKTHLLHAVGHQSGQALRRDAVVYLSSERFTNELINAIRYDRTAEFRGALPHDRPPAHRRHPVHLRQGADAGRVLPHLQRPLRVAQADRRLQRLLAQGHPGHRGAPALALRVGPDRRHPAAGLRDARRDPQEEGRARAGAPRATTSPT